MFANKHKQNIIFNSNLPLFAVLCFCGAFYLSYCTSLWYLLFFCLVPFTFLKHKPNWKQWLICGSLIFCFILLTAFANQFSLIDLINKRPQVIRKEILRFYDNHYNEETASFIKLILFNIKSDKSWIFYKQVVDLGIVWLICISGFHISLLNKIVNWIFKKKPVVAKYVNISIVSVYSYLLNFSYASLRILLKLSLSTPFNMFGIKQHDRLGFVGMCLCIFNPKCFISYGFLLSFIICVGSYWVKSLNLNNKLLSSLLVSIIAFIITIPFVIDMNHKISLLSFVNAFVFSYASSFIFLYFVLFSLMPFMAIVHYGIMVCAYVLIGNISFGNIYITSNTWPVWSKFIYYAGLFGLEKAVYLIVINNKI